MKIAFYDTKPYDRNFFDKVNEKYNYKIKYFESKLNEDTVAMAKGYEAVCAFVNDSINATVIDQLYEGGTRLIAMRCAGYNNVDFETANNKIRIVRVPAYSPYSVAEHTMALIVSLNRKIHKAYNRTRESNFNINGLLGFDLHGKTIGIIGTGKIGQIVADIANGYGMRVIGYDKYPAKESKIEYVDLHTLYKESDIITLHCPLFKDTYHIINAESIHQMKEGVMIINTSRGGLIDTDSLIQGIKERKIGSAGLDVYEEESDYFFEDFSNQIIEDDTLARLLTFNNVLITSHQAFFTREALENIAETTLYNINEFEKGNELVNEICYNCQH
jgi:D-lactate dehydrogenase